jgi:hypothetical protein
MAYVWTVLSAVVFGMLLYLIARKRGTNKKFWLLMGIIFGIFALPFVFFAKTNGKKL